MENIRRLCVFLTVLVFIGGQVKAETLEEKMRADPDISQFYTLLEHCEVCNVTLLYESVTIFAPINAAFQKLDDNTNKGDTDTLVEYHMTNIPKKTDQLGSSYTSINSKVPGGPPLWITHSSGMYHNDIYINNARVLVGRSNVIGTTVGPKGHTFTHILHKIDEVLIPTRASPELLYNPTAWEFIDQYELFIQQQPSAHRLRYFRQKVKDLKKQDIFKTEGGHTFFIPVDDGFGNNKANFFDQYIIDGHVVPKKVLFTTPTTKDVPWPTLANSDNELRVVVSFTQEKRGNTIINYVKSHTLFSAGKHKAGVVLAEIVKPNIPVKNGVIHLIRKPLIIVDSTVGQLLEEQEGGILDSFLRAIKNSNDPSSRDFLKTLESAHEVTLFAPCNKAFEGGDLVLSNILANKERFAEILNMHLVVDKTLYVDQVQKNSYDKIFQAPTLRKGKNLYFNVIQRGQNKTMTVEGGGVNATVIQADLAAKNGIIHVIDRVLGVPYTTVMDKLKTDPMLRQTYELGNLQGFNNQLNDTTRRFTYFVPRDKAWSDARIRFPSAIKKLFMKEYAYHATNTLERHLVISDTPYTMERIKQLTSDMNNSFGRGTTTNHLNREVQLPSVRDTLSIYVEERPENTFTIYWKGNRIPVFRPNVECTNGIIHVIDAPFLEEGDIVVNSSPTILISPFILIICLISYATR